MRKGFTLIELLVVIAIIAVLAVVVVLVLNPAELLKQSRDSNRVSDMATLTHAITLYQTDQGSATGYFLGNASSVYLSLIDPAATTTAGTDCTSLGLPSLSAGYSYHCAASSTYRSVNGTGWIPIDFASTTTGSPLGSLPVDPTNNSSTGLYYAYSTNGNQFELTSLFESSKYKSQYRKTPMDPMYPGVDAKGSSLAISPLYNPSGLVGWWPMDEGSGSSTKDMSGNGNDGTWYGTPTGENSTYYAAGKVGSYAGDFDGSSTYINVGNPPTLQITGDVTLAAWIYPYAVNGGSSDSNPVISGRVSETAQPYSLQWYTDGLGSSYETSNGWVDNYVGGGANPLGNWTYISVSRNGNINSLYENGILLGTITGNSGSVYLGNGVLLGKGFYGGPHYFNGLIDDVRIYNRALSAAEVQALYNAEK